MMRMSLQTGLTVMAGFLFGFAELFEEAHSVLEANKLATRLAEKYRHDMHEWQKIVPGDS